MNFDVKQTGDGERFVSQKAVQKVVKK